MATLECRLAALESVARQAQTRTEPYAILVGFPDDDQGQPLEPGWNPEHQVFQLVWPDELANHNRSEP